MVAPDEEATVRTERSEQPERIIRPELARDDARRRGGAKPGLRSRGHSCLIIEVPHQPFVDRLRLGVADLLIALSAHYRYCRIYCCLDFGVGDLRDQSARNALRRSLGLDVLACPQCGGRLQLIALIDDPAVIGRILHHLGVSPEIPEARPARAPPLHFPVEAAVT